MFNLYLNRWTLSLVCVIVGAIVYIFGYETVKEGMTNHSYKFTYDGIEYFARVPGEDTDTYIDRKAEGEILEKLKSANITEEVVYFDKNAGYKISKYLHGARPLNVNDENEIKNSICLM